MRERRPAETRSRSTKKERGTFKILSYLIPLMLVLDISLWLTVPADDSRVKLFHLSSTPLLFLGFIFLLTVASIGARAILTTSALLRSRLLGALLLIALLPLLRFVQIYSDLGVFILDGSRHWIARAAATEDPDQAKAYLAIVLSATQYGVNEAENQVLANDDQRERERLFRLLSEIAPNETWRQRYMDRWRNAAGNSR